jgi:hypothetical protein
VWLEYGQFTAFLGPGFLGDKTEERERWRRDGAEAILKAVELGAAADRAVSAATILSNAGELDATIAALGRAMAATQDPAARDEIQKKLDRLNAKAQGERWGRQIQAVESRWQKAFPFLTREMFLLIGPRLDSARCVGPDTEGAPECARDWDEVVRQAEGR